MKRLYEVEPWNKAEKINSPEMSREISDWIDANPETREQWAAVIKARAELPKRRRKAPDRVCMSVGQNTESSGGTVVNKYCLPKDIWPLRTARYYLSRSC